MKERKVFKSKYFSKEFGEIRTILDCDKPEVLFCAKDVARTLGFKNPSTSVRDICLNCVKEAHMTDGGLQVMNFIGWKDIRRLYNNSKSDRKQAYAEFLVYVEDNLYRSHLEKYKSPEDEALCGCPICDVERKGVDSIFCCGDCGDCSIDFTDVCPDYCPGDCDICPNSDTCCAYDEDDRDNYEDTHDPGYLELVKKLSTEEDDKEDAVKECLFDFLNTLYECSPTYRNNIDAISKEYHENMTARREVPVIVRGLKGALNLIATRFKEEFGSDIMFGPVVITMEDGKEYCIFKNEEADA